MMLIEEWEKAIEEIKKIRAHIKELSAQYRISKDPDLKKEIEQQHEKIRKVGARIKKTTLSHIEEVKLLKKYYPELLEEYIEDKIIGDFVKKHIWAAELKPISDKEAMAALHEIKNMREALRIAKKYAQSFGLATLQRRFPFLKDIKSREEALEVIKRMNKKLKQEGWKIILSSPQLTTTILTKYVLLIKELEEKKRKSRYQSEKKSAEKKIKKLKTLAEQILLASPTDVLETIKRTKKPAPLWEIAANVKKHHPNEREWLKKMSQKLQL